MKNYFSTLDEILYKGLRPWLNANNPDEKFASMISAIKTVSPIFQPHYEIKFERPFNSKTKYYTKLITNETINSCNQLFDVLMEDETPQLILYRLNDTLSKKIKTRLKDVGKLIKDQKFEIDYINPRKTTFDIDQEHKTNTFIIQLLKLSLMYIYLEIQEKFRQWIQDELILEDFYSQLLFEPIPVNSCIEKIQLIEITPSEPNIIIEKSPNHILSVNSFTYNQYFNNPDKLNDLFDSLKHFGFISDSSTLANFKKVFSNKEIVNPIIWTGNPSEFSYFIKLFYVQYKFVANLKQKQWDIACKCFVQADGSLFDKSKLRGLKKPQLSYKQLEVAVTNLK
jgi:hypothetical protein